MEKRWNGKKEEARFVQNCKADEKESHDVV